MTPDRLLLRLPNWLGDVVLARALCHGVRKARPLAEVRAVAPAALLELLAGDGCFDVAHPWPAEGRERDALVRTLRAWRPEAALILPPSWSSAWFARRTGARERIGFAHEGRSPLLTRALRRPARGERHLSREYLDLGAPLGVRDGQAPLLAPSSQARADAGSLLEERAAPYAILGAGAVYGPAKRWPPERFVELGRALAAQGMQVLLCGAGSERALLEPLAAAIGPAARSLAGRTSLPAQLALCAGARVAVCNDSGLAHLAAASGAPTVVIFGSTSSAWTAPIGPRVRVVQDAPVCSPCFQRTCAIGYRCLTRISVGRVLEAGEAVAA